MHALSKHLRNVFLLLSLGVVGLVTGFGLGVVWTMEQTTGFADYNSVQALKMAEDALKAQADRLRDYQKLVSELKSDTVGSNKPVASKISKPVVKKKQQVSASEYYSGEDLMQAVNKYRREHGVPELQLHSGLCQLASRRLGEIIDRGELDNHAGFESYFKDRDVSDLNGPAISNVAENLASGYSTAWDVVMGWDSSPPHRRFLLSDGSYKYGCGTANLDFAVLIGGF